MTAPAGPDAALVARAVAWRDEDPDPATRAELDGLLDGPDGPDLDALHARFDERLQFGTAGLRGAVGAGPGRMNRAMVRRATAGVAAWLRATGEDGPVVIGRDARHGSAAFAADAAAVLAGAGRPVLVLPGTLPTPVLAFAVRHLGAAAGIMITASHNPAADNGYKLYLGDGAQIVAPADREISTAIDAVGPLEGVPLSDAGIVEVGPELVDAYVAGAVSLVQPGPRDLRIVYTAMHGVGAPAARAAFDAAGFAPPVEVPEQAEPDPDFPTVAFPNPEEPGALDLALALAADVAADVILANDPDADRLAVAAPMGPHGRWRPLTGDEVGALLADHLLRTRPHDDGDVVATTVVSSRLLARLAAAAGVAYVEVLTGFKWVARAPGPGRRLLFGYEEALGYSVDDMVRDKDGITAALVAAELVASLKAQGLTLQDRLDELHRRHGVHCTASRSLRVGGADWLDRVTAAMASLRQRPPGDIAGHPVVGVEDLLSGERLPPSDVVIWTVAGGRVVVRPSGTEPKIKCYAEAVEPLGVDGDLAAARTAAESRVTTLLEAGLDRLGDLGL